MKLRESQNRSKSLLVRKENKETEINPINIAKKNAQYDLKFDISEIIKRSVLRRNLLNSKAKLNENTYESPVQSKKINLKKKILT